jgi:hypothetical protein
VSGFVAGIVVGLAFAVLLAGMTLIWWIFA